MLKLYITRHGETVWNVEKRLQGWKDSALTQNGIQNAIALGEALKDTTFKAIYASPSERTLHTAKLIKRERDIPFYMEEKLREINMGDWEGHTYEDVNKREADSYFSFWNKPHLFKTDKGESFFELQERAISAVNQIRSSHPTGNILIVTHTVVIKSLIAYFKNSPLENLWDPPYIHDTSLTVIELGEESKILLEGDVSHRNGANLQ